MPASLDSLYGLTSEKEVLEVINNPNLKIEFVRIMFPDILGRPMDFSIPSSELERAFSDGKGFDGSSVEGFVRIEESDLVIVPEARTFRVFPWIYTGFDGQTIWREAIMFGDIYTPEHEHYAGDSRFVLKKMLAKAREEFGFDDFKCGPELEFFIFPDDQQPVPTDAGEYFFAGRHGEIRKEIQLLLRKMGIESEFDHHEAAHGQHEIDLRYGSAVEIADKVMIFRYMAKKVARMHNLYATFMPKPINGQNGSGMHVHQSLWRGNHNAFFDSGSTYHLSPEGQYYTAGIMCHARAICPVLSQWVNSYKRLIEGYEAPVYIAWGQKNRSAYIRVPEYQPGKEKATRIELRSPDPGCNVYLAMALMLAAGLDGIKNQIPLPSPVEENIYELSIRKQKKAGIQLLPRNLQEGIKMMEKSQLVRETLGEHIFQKFLANKQKEIEDYLKSVPEEYDEQVSPYEIKRYLPML
ncbi:MAG TPA: type I glutamate--ammonia ligase [Candidatus Saccharicenans sp.]|nr:type I glutamate--ammonia ligase [Candidatus Saccharicenans sp.]